MKLIYTARNMLMVAHMRNLLEVEGIDTRLRNEFLGSGAGELPPTETWPELWVVDDEQAERARVLVADATEKGAEPSEKWQCPVCKEDIDGNFAQCWKCGEIRHEA